MELNEVLALMERFEGSAIQRMELESKGFRLMLDKAVPVAAAPVAAVPVAAPVPAAAPAAAPAPAPEAPAAAPAEAEGTLIKAPLVGTFYAAASPDAAPFAPVGAQVKAGQTLCILEAMKMMSEVPSPVSGVITEVLVSDGELVGFDQPLFRVKAC